tara:strand:+ start:117 stop:221 length:105 start_codon:yes stop_codon:yes gene_type:complete
MIQVDIARFVKIIQRIVEAMDDEFARQSPNHAEN